ncbi:SOS response-associated peptidase [Mesorhizobium sp. YM1C-6-2]|uniref:SOS response-associated peptidase n=1 Tax=Mesorhizobium sp. YM1C-6-2 TaxID=1827501 RepID=UPI001FE03D09|nr:SOS response-associated peptidase [Mesorhizobium sp. YM1C-6-2]
MPKGAMFNARIETADTSSAFKDAWKSKRCLIPADGFYEWTRNQSDGGRDPWFIHLTGTQPFSFAGLWALNSKLDVTSCTIITMPASEPMTQLHDRQPAILAPEAYDSWMDPATPAADVKPLLANNLDGELQFHRVDRRVNASSKTDKPNDEASMIGPINPL